jgi:hypothetical protein
MYFGSRLDYESVNLQLLALKYLDLAHYTRYQSLKMQNDANSCLKHINQALQLCMAHQASTPTFFTYFNIRKMDMNHLLENRDQSMATIEETTKKLNSVRSLRSFKSKALSIRENYKKQQLICVSVLQLRKVMEYIEKGENKSATKEISSFGSESSQTIRSIPEINDILAMLRVSILFQEAKFALVLKGLEQIQASSIFKKTLFSACLRFIGSIQCQKELESTTMDQVSVNRFDQTSCLAAIESNFAVSIHTGKLIQGKQWLLEYRSRVIKNWPKSIPTRIQATYHTMNGMLGISCGRFEFGLHCLSMARSLATNTSDLHTLDLHMQLTTLQTAYTDSKRERPFTNVKGPASLWYVPKALSLVDSNTNQVTTDFSASIKENGSLHLAIWSKFDSALSQAIKMAKQATYIEGEFHAYKKMLSNPEETVIQRGESAQEIWSKQRALLASYRAQVEQVLV